MRSVEAMPRSTTSTPCDRTPSAKAADKLTPDGRMSRAMSTRGAAAHRRIELIGYDAPDVVGLEDSVEVTHMRRNLAICAAAQPTTDSEQVPNEAKGIASHAHRRPRGVDHRDRHLCQREPVALGDHEDL